MIQGEAADLETKEAGELTALRQSKTKLIATQARPSGTGLPNRTLALDEIGDSTFRFSLLPYNRPGIAT